MVYIVQVRFHVPVIAKKWILTSMGSKWRNWKHYLKTRYLADVPIEHLIDEKDDSVLPEQWVKLITYGEQRKLRYIFIYIVVRNSLIQSVHLIFLLQLVLRLQVTKTREPEKTRK